MTNRYLAGFRGRGVQGAVLAAAALALFPVAVAAWQLDPAMFSGMQWRLIGPYRAGRVTAVAGIPGQPAIYYMGTPGGGVWKTTDGGRVWFSIFDQEHVASIGALALAASNPAVIYVGTGEQTPGNGVYKSTDAGATWKNVGLEKTRYITGILVDSHDPDTVLVASAGGRVLGPPAGQPVSGEERGIFKSTDGGKTWKHVLSAANPRTGAFDLTADPSNSRVVFAAFWQRRGGPPAKAATAPAPAPAAAIYKSEDEGDTWQPISGHGLPEKGMGRIGLAVAAGNNGQRVFAIMSQGLFRSDDGGANWQRITTDPRVVGSGYFSRVFADPGNSDIVFVMQTSAYRSTDGGRTFASYVGAPSGDDFHVLWIDPRNSQRMMLGVDQGAIVSRDGGQTWSSWYNQPTGQFYHVSTDNVFPYRVYAAQQDSGTVAVPSRSDYGEISFRDWFSTGGFEDGYIAADAVDPNIIYSGGWYGTVLRFDKVTGQYATVFERGKRYRTGPADPLEFSPQHPHTLYLGTQYVLKTTDGGATWQEASPDLTLKPDKDPKKKPAQGIIFTLALSPLQDGVMWAGASTGLIQLTQDGGKSWQNVTPPGLPDHSVVNIIDASHSNPAWAYAAVDNYQDNLPYIYRTHDAGKTWEKAVNGIPPGSMVRVVREDPVRPGLLYAGTMTGVYVSFDDGDHWQPLQLNLPTATVTDLAVHGDDLVASTFGRALWILDDVTPLRQVTAETADTPVTFFQPQTAIRTRWDENQDTPLPRETPAGKNPPDGAIFDYYLKSAPAGDITLRILDKQNQVVRQYSSTPEALDTSLANAPSYWFAPPAVLARGAGQHRFVWNLRYPHAPALRYSYFGSHLDYTEYTLADHAIPGETPVHQPQGPLVAPGDYTAVLTVDGQEYRQALHVALDPRVHVTQEDLQTQLDWDLKIGAGMKTSYDAYHQVTALRSALAGVVKSLNASAGGNKDALAAATALAKSVDALVDGTRDAPGFGPVNRDLARLETSVESADWRPGIASQNSVRDSCAALQQNLAKWRDLNARDVAALNATLQSLKLRALPVAAPDAAAGCGL
jgi:photosystem II stability/assembly factor-like uncharacterized protein